MIFRFFMFAVMALGLMGFGTVAWVSSRPPAAPAGGAMPERHDVLIAAKVLHAGELLKPEDLTTQEMATNTIPDGARIDTPEARGELLGAMIRRSLSKSELIMPPDVLRPGDHGFLAAVLGAGMRGITVGVDATSGIAGLIWPGDRVDVILTQSIEDNSVLAGHRVLASTVLADVLVIAIDQRLVQGATSAQDQQQGRTATLEVTQAQAQSISVAMRLGRLSLTVRAAEAAAIAVPAPVPTWASDVSPAFAARTGSSEPETMRVFQGSDAREFHF